MPLSILSGAISGYDLLKCVSSRNLEVILVILVISTIVSPLSDVSRQN
jgi:hypothetical protein